MRNITSNKEDITKALWLIENVYNGQGLVVGFFLAFSIHAYFLYVGYVGASILYVWLLGILFGYTHSYLRYRTFLNNPKIYAEELDAQRMLYKFPIVVWKKKEKTLRFLLYEWYVFIYIAVVFIVSGITAPDEYFILVFFLGLGIWGIFLFIFWRYRIRPKINKKLDIIKSSS